MADTSTPSGTTQPIGYVLNVDSEMDVFEMVSPPNFSTNPNNTDAYLRNETLANVEIAVLAVILFMALFGNLIVIIVLLYRKAKLSRMQMFIVHLCIADMFVGIFQVLPQLVMDITYRFDGNDFLCKLVKYMQLATMYGSTYVLIMTALDRYMSICRPLMSQTWTMRRVHLMALIAWLLSGVFSIPQLVLFSYKERVDGTHDCLDNFDLQNEYWTLQAYVTWIFVSIFAVPCLMLAACYAKICHVVWVSVNAKENGQCAKRKTHKYNKSNSSSASYSPVVEIKNPRAHSKKMSNSKIKTVKLTLTVVICFVVCWTPFFITQMWAAFDLNAPYYTSHVMAITTLLSSLNSCTNPWIYLAFSGRLCWNSQPGGSSAKMMMSSANTYVTEVGGDTVRMRTINRDHSYRLGRTAV